MIDVHVYRHPGVRRKVFISKKSGEAFMEEFIRLCDLHPTLLFNVTGHGGQAQNRGFVMLHTRMLDGCEIIKDLL